MSKISLMRLPSLFTTTDEQAMWRLQTEDDPAAFAQLMERWQGPIRRLCERMLGDAHRAEDLAQETFARLFARRKEYQPSGRFSTFLWRVALNLCYDELRRIRRRGEQPFELIDEEPPADKPEMLSSQASPDRHLMSLERAEIVRRALQELPDPYRTVIVLRHYEDLKFREIAEVLEIPEGTVKSRMAEAMAQLSLLLREEQQGKSEHSQPVPLTRKESLIL